MTQTFSAILRQFGRAVQLVQTDGSGRGAFGFLQAMPLSTQDAEQFLPTELGVARQESFLYLGAGDCPLTGVSQLLCDGASYDVHAAQPVYLGQQVSHWRAVLRLREEAAG